jgi:hypothetical protein
MVSPARAELAATQLALARALLDEGPVPPGFDVERVKLLAGTLSHKRARSAAAAWPSLQRLLGAHFYSRFSDVVSPLPLAREHGPLFDGLRLAERLEAEQRLDAPTAAALASVRLRYRAVPNALEPRAGVTFARARAMDGLALAVRLPGLGQKVFWLRRSA